MTQEIVKVDLTKFGLDEAKAKAVKADFDAVLKIAVELEDEYNDVVKQEISPETCERAKVLRRKYVKVRTGIAAVHKERKAFYLSGGRAVDGLKNAYTHAVEGNEAKLLEIENYYVNIEMERIRKLEEDRTELAAKYDVDVNGMNVGQMDEAVWSNFIEGARSKWEAVREAEAKAESERVAREKAEEEERERIRIENERLKAEAEERERVEKERLAKEKAERDRIEAEHRKEREEAERKLAAERAERERVEKEQRDREEAERKEAEEQARREKNRAHKARVNREAMNAIGNASGVTEEQAKKIVVAIVEGKVPAVTIKY